MITDQRKPITPEDIFFVYDEKRQAIIAAAEPVCQGADYRLLGQIDKKLADSEEIQLLFFEHLIGICRGERHMTEMQILKGDLDRPMRLLPQELSA